MLKVRLIKKTWYMVFWSRGRLPFLIKTHFIQVLFEKTHLCAKINKNMFISKNILMEKHYLLLRFIIFIIFILVPGPSYEVSSWSKHRLDFETHSCVRFFEDRATNSCVYIVKHEQLACVLIQGFSSAWHFFIWC